METVETILNKVIENGSYEMVGIEYHDHIIYCGSLENLRRTLGYYVFVKEKIRSGITYSVINTYSSEREVRK